MRQTARLDAVPPVTRSVDQRADDLSQPSAGTKRAAESVAGVPDYIVNVSRPHQPLPWRWTSVLLAPVEFLAMSWSVPFVILLVGIPVVLAVALLHWMGRFLLSYL